MRTPEDIVSEILASRGIDPLASIEEFFSEKPALTYDPFLLPDMEEGVDFLLSSIKSGKRICIYGDYDVDGTLAAALLTEWFRGFAPKGDDIAWHIPLRVEEGYGLNFDSIRGINDKGFDIIITVDCGSVSREEVAYARSLGLDIIITDHHDCPGHLLPECLVINPKREGSNYPFRELSGCGVAFKLAQGMSKRMAGDKGAVQRLNRLLDFVAVATVADVTPLTDENRTLVKYGLSMLRKGRRKAFGKLVSAISLDSNKLTAWNIAFGIAPHLNAAGRLSDAGKVVELFTTDDGALMDAVISELIIHNSDRRKMQDEAVEECIRLADEVAKDDLLLFLKPANIHEGIAGIVAGRIKEWSGRPVLILSETPEGNLKGSGRSVRGVDLIALLREEEAMFIKLGGHKMAAGFTILAENEEPLRRKLNARLKAMLNKNPDLMKEDPLIEAELSPEEGTLGLAEKLQGFEPTGHGNPKPSLMLRDVPVDAPRFMGKDGQHMRFSVKGLECVLFNRAEEFKEMIVAGAVLSIIGNLDINEWNGSLSPQFLIREIIS